MSSGVVLVVLFVLINNIVAANNLKNERNIKNKMVIVTGGAQGIGYAIADNILKSGARTVVILDINKKKGEKAAQTFNSKYGENKAEFIECDITKDLDRVSELIMLKYGYVDLLVNNAGVADESKPQKILLTNAMGTILWSLKYVDYMRKDNCRGRGGTIINIASIIVENIDPSYRTYRGSKLAIQGFSLTQGHSYNYNITGVRVLTLCPGPTNTSMVYSIDTHYDKCLVTSIKKKYLYSNVTIQSPGNVGKAVMTLFENADSGTSWIVANEKPPYESSYTINILPFKVSEDDPECKQRRTGQCGTPLKNPSFK